MQAKMSSLVADYVSSSGSDSESEAEISTNLKEKGNKTQHNLLTSQDTSSSSDSDSNDCQKKVSTSYTSKSSAMKTVDEDSGNCPLPLPQVFSSEPSSSGNSLIGLSVFANPFEQARQDQLSILEKHVKMKEQEKSDNTTKGNQKICYKFQKGKCRFGDTCKFSHGSNHQPVVLTGGNREAYPSAASGGHMGAPFQDGFYHDDERQRAEEEETIRKRKKDRAGLSETLIPSKKAMRIYDRQRTQERPWTEKR